MLRKDEAEQREASRLIKMLKSMDRVQLKADAKAQFIVNSGDDAQQFFNNKANNNKQMQTKKTKTKIQISGTRTTKTKRMTLI